MDIKAIRDIAREAGDVILEVYGHENIDVTIKDDKSPLTEADRRSHDVIMRGLTALFPNIPVLSEEGAAAAYERRMGWNRFFLVDPLDGTKEFINRNGEFTVNIALIEEGEPVAGVIFVPVRDVMYWASRGDGAWRLRAGDSEPLRITLTPLAEHGAPLRIVASRSHGSEALEEFLDGIAVSDKVSAGSSLKFCLVAQGDADLYPRFGPTWEWDTAAGDAIVREAGGVVYDSSGDGPLRYNKELPKHRGFIVGRMELIERLRHKLRNL